MNREFRILLIDDDVAWLETLAEFLSEHGYSVLTAGDAVSGLDLLDAGNIQLAVIDGHMPDAEGIDLIRRVHRSRKPVAIIVVSGDEGPEMTQSVLAAGARAFVPKTASPRFLLRAVREALEGAEAPAKPLGRFQYSPRFLPVLHRATRYLPVPFLGPRPFDARPK